MAVAVACAWSACDCGPAGGGADGGGEATGGGAAGGGGGSDAGTDAGTDAGAIIDGGVDDGGIDGGVSDGGSLGQAPIARLTACSPAMLTGDPDCVRGLGSPASFNLSAITPDEITVSAVNSSDDGQVVMYRFTLLPPIPGGTTASALANNGTRGSALKTVLTIPAGATGTYRVGLEVWDDRGQKSAATAVMTLNIYP